MNWYQVFYWVSVADGLKSFSQTIGIIALIVTLIATIGYFVSTNYASGFVVKGSEEEQSTDYKEWIIWVRAYKRVFSFAITIAFISGLLCVFTPSKKDALVIIAGGAVGNFITSDSSAKQIPREVTILLREKIKSEIKELKNPLDVDTLQEKSKEELIEILKQKK